MSITKDTMRFTLLNNLSELESLTGHLEAVAQKWDIPQKTVLQLNLILDELFTNIVTYGFTDDLEHKITMIFEKKKSELQITIIDDGCCFDLTCAKDPDLEKPLPEKEIGGMGIFLARQYADELTYKRKGSKNIVILIKKIK